MAFVHVQTIFFGTAAGAAVTYAPLLGTPTGANFTTGSRCFGVVEYYRNNTDPAVTLVSVTDQAATPITYAEPATQQYDTTDGTGVLAFDIPNMPAGVTSLIITMSAIPAFGSNGCISEYTGLVTTAADTASSAQGSIGTGTDAVTSGTASNTGQPALVWGFSTEATFLSTPAAGTGFTDRGSATGQRVEDKRVTATGSQATTFTNTHGSASRHITVMFVVDEPGGGGGGGIVLFGQVIM